MIIKFFKKILAIIVSASKNEIESEWLQRMVALILFLIIALYGPRTPQQTNTGNSKTVEKPIGKESLIGSQKNPYQSSKNREGRTPGRAYPVDPPRAMEGRPPREREGRKPHFTPMDPETGFGKELQKKDK